MSDTEEGTFIFNEVLLDGYDSTIFFTRAAGERVLPV